MNTGYDVDLPEEGDVCSCCVAPAAAKISGVPHCGFHADQEFEDWRKYLPSKPAPVVA
ncbi:hypothetical protein HY948_01025 [Candidatus Gottesmanbacteria bacterium]|nr:hypothetical protein [Candidatus Gottesmanbacteria bacterium]